MRYCRCTSKTDRSTAMDQRNQLVQSIRRPPALQQWKYIVSIWHIALVKHNFCFVVLAYSFCIYSTATCKSSYSHWTDSNRTDGFWRSFNLAITRFSAMSNAYWLMHRDRNGESRWKRTCCWPFSHWAQWDCPIRVWDIWIIQHKLSSNAAN